MLRMFHFFILITLSLLAPVLTWDRFIPDYFNDQSTLDQSWNKCPLLMIITSDFIREVFMADLGDIPLFNFNSASMVTADTLEHIRESTSCVNILTENADDARQIDQALRINRKRFWIFDVKGTMSRNLSLNSPTRIFSHKNGQFLEYEICDRLSKPWSFLRSLWHQNDQGHYEIRQRSTLRCPCPLNGKLMKISTFGLQPYIYYNGSLETISGVDVDIVNILAEKYNFDIQFSMADFFGNKDDRTNRWNGVVGEVLYGKSEMGIGNLMATDLERREVIDALAAPYQLELPLLAPLPKPLKSYMNLTKPFSLASWVCVLITLICVCMVLLFMNEVFDSNNISKGHAIWECFSTPYVMLLQEYSLLSSSISSLNHGIMVLLAFWMPVGYILSLFYSCNLSAYLVRMDFEKAIDSMQDIIDDGRILYIPINTALYSTMEASPIESHKQLFKLAQSNDGQGFYTIKEGWISEEKEEEILRNRGVLCYPTETVKLRYAIFMEKYNMQPFRISPKVIFSFPSGFLVPKDFPFKEEFNQAIRNLVSMGIMDGLKRKYFPLEALIEPKPDRDAVILDMEHLLGAIFALILGFTLAALAFIVETWKIGCASGSQQEIFEIVSAIP